MLNVFNHAADNDVVFCQHRVFHGIEDDIFSVYRLVGGFGNV